MEYLDRRFPSPDLTPLSLKLLGDCDQESEEYILDAGPAFPALFIILPCQLPLHFSSLLKESVSLSIGIPGFCLDTQTVQFDVIL